MKRSAFALLPWLLAGAVQHPGDGKDDSRAAEALPLPVIATEGMKPETLDALEHAESDVRAHPERASTWARLGAIYDSRQLYEQAEVCYREAYSRTAGNFSYAYMHARVGDLIGSTLKDTIGRYEEAERIDPQYPPLHLYKGDCYARHGKLEEARASYEQALDLKQDYPAAQLGLGQSLLNLGRPKEALEHLEKAAEAAPEDRSVNTALARAYMQTGQRERARFVAERTRSQARGLDDEDKIRRDALSQVASAHDSMHRAEHAMAEERYEEAIPDIEQFLKDRPHSPDVRYSLAYAYFRSGRRAEALEECLTAVSQDASLVDPRVLAAQILVSRRPRDSERAIRLLVQALRLQPENLGALVLLGNELVQVGQFEPAVEAFEKGYSIKELDAQSHLAWGVALLQLERHGEAERHFRVALVMNPRYAAAQFNLGLVLERQERLPEALAAFRAAARINPNLPIEPHVRAIEERLRGDGD